MRNKQLFTYFVELLVSYILFCYITNGDYMEMFYTNNTLYINIEDRLNLSLINNLQKKLYRIIDSYHIINVEINILNDTHYDKSLINDLINDYKVKYNGKIIVK